MKTTGVHIKGVKRTTFRRTSSLTPVVLLTLAFLLNTIAMPTHVRASDSVTAPIANAQSSAGSPTLTINFVGDILLASTVGKLIEAEGPDAPWERVAEVLRSADITVGNLESAVGVTGEPIEGKAWTFRAAPESLQGLKNAGFDVVSLANNHSMDYGVECLLETVEHVRSYGMASVGAGKDEPSARTPFIFEKDGISVGILATSMVIPSADWRTDGDKPGMAADYVSLWPRLKASIDELRPKVDHIAVILHWGEERKETPEEEVLLTEGRLKEAGVSMIIGSHPHVLRGISFDGTTVTAHSLGNFVFTTRPDIPACQEGGILTVTLTETGIQSVQFTPTEIVWGKTYLMEGDRRRATLSRVASLSRIFDTGLEESGDVFPITFSDMHGHWAAGTVSKMYRMGLVQGYADESFRPDGPLTVGEFAALLSRTMGPDEQIRATPAPEGYAPYLQAHWANPYIAFLMERGVLGAGEAGTDPESPCTREMAITWIWRAGNTDVRQDDPAAGDTPTAHAQPQDKEPSAGSWLPFIDAPQQGTELFSAAQWCFDRGVLRGFEDGTLRLQETLTRAQSAAMILRYVLS